MALAPWLFGVLADATSSTTSIWTGIGISFLAGIINAPLMRRPEMGPPPPRVPAEKRILPGEDVEAAEEALSGEHVDPALVFTLNLQRGREGKRFIVPSVKTYSDDKESLDELRENARENFKFRTELMDRVLCELSDPNSEVNNEELCKFLNNAARGDPDVIDEHTRDVGQWISDYLRDSGYQPHVNSVLLKQMVMSAFPTVNTAGEMYTPETIEDSLIRSRHVMGKYLEHEESKVWKIRSILGKGNRPQFYA